MCSVTHGAAGVPMGDGAGGTGSCPDKLLPQMQVLVLQGEASLDNSIAVPIHSSAADLPRDLERL